MLAPRRTGPGERREPGRYRAGFMFGGLLAAVPLVTSIAAMAAEWRVQADTARIERTAAPATAALEQHRAAHAALAALADAPSPSALVERIAVVLPSDARVVAVERDTGRTTLVISSVDPDALRRSLRRDPLLASLRETGQRRDGAAMLVTMVGR